MIKAFIDTNVLIDLLLERDGCQDAATILLCQKEQKCSLFLSSLTMANIAYILRKKFIIMSDKQARREGVGGEVLAYVW